MNPRKTDKADLEKKKGLYLQIGIVLALSMVWMAFEWKTFESGPSSLGTLDNVVIDDDMIATNRKPPPPPPPPPAVTMDKHRKITMVSNSNKQRK